MRAFALILLTLTGTYARTFNITFFNVPETVQPDQYEAELECRYDANFTLLSWFKGPQEFFRYKPAAAPSTRSFPIKGVGSVEMVACGPSVCILKLGALTDEATGLYRCDIERDVPPYKFATRTAHMRVLGHEHGRPKIDGLAAEYRDGDQINAYCRPSEKESEIRWYFNGRELMDMRGSATLKTVSSQWTFMGSPPTVTVQCAEFLGLGQFVWSKEVTARKIVSNHTNETPHQEQRNVNVSNGAKRCLSLLYLICFVYNSLCSIII